MRSEVAARFRSLDTTRTWSFQEEAKFGGGVYRADLVIRHHGLIRWIVEFFDKDFDVRAVVGAAVLADHFAGGERLGKPTEFIWVGPDDTKLNDLRYVDERVGIARPYVRNLKMRNAMKVMEFQSEISQRMGYVVLDRAPEAHP